MHDCIPANTDDKRYGMAPGQFYVSAGAGLQNGGPGMLRVC